MANLLPQEEKKKITKEYYLRLSVVSLIVCSILVIINLVFLVPAYLEAHYKERDAMNRIEHFSSSGVGGGGLSDEELNKQIAALNKKILSFIPKAEDGLPRSLPTSILTKLINAKSEAIKIVGFAYNFDQGKERFVISGTARDRESLAVFVDVFKKDPYFTSAELPIQSYVKSADIDFTLTLTRIVKATPTKK